ncbi:MAG: 5-formyltetrahydrofolate cyclo-ligase [Bacteroidales bacterium]|nr:5-formyltetrahydrofolate cyclo-ligase [Bacteroidales bacterium]
MITKSELRKLISNRKKEYSVDTKIEKSKAIFKQVRQLKEFQEAKKMLCYWSMPDEVPTHDFVIEISGNKEIYLPVVSGDDLLIRKFTGTDNMEEGVFATLFEPNHTENINIKDIDLVLVPGVAFDLSRRRMGRGKGYYDRLLADTNVYKLGICFDFQLVEYVPTDERDILMDKVIFG